MVDISESRSAWRKYRHIVPVIMIDGKVELHGKIDEQRMRRLLGSLG
ncbi:MAG: glutaredoxin family protein [Candidatus Bathyarchaeia archaeon]